MHISHNRLYKPAYINNTILIQSGCHGSFIGRLDINISQGKVVKFQHKLINVSEDILPGSRNNMDVKPEEVMVSIPANDLERIVNNLEEMKTKTFFRED